MLVKIGWKRIDFKWESLRMGELENGRVGELENWRSCFSKKSKFIFKKLLRRSKRFVEKM